MKNAPVTPPSIADPLTTHFAIYPRRTSHISTGSLPLPSPLPADCARLPSGVVVPSLLLPLPPMPLPGAPIPLSSADGMRGLGTPALALDGAPPSAACPKSVPVPKSALETTASSHSYPGRKSTRRTGKEV